MALLVRHYNIASQFAVDPDHNITSTPIPQGRIIRLDSNKYVQRATGTTALAIAGDSLANDTGYTAYAADLTISPSGATRSTQNRISDAFNETLASGKMTVYHSGGEFFSDQYVAAPSAGWDTPGAAMYSSATGQYTTDNGGSDRVVGYLLAGPTAYPSGVPGTDTPDNSISLGTFIQFQLAL